ncbi:hypothetical protein SADUNF_Sadunf06G0002400 [Salix dunnii]|uniref:Uncharacterized protein n=1 Tax=Salix dunnii TaxID=1413687 RepID=A0A835K4N2_9ROSI|nr:hypothetical protein SADUNF_Sadunf06G0002400 [Salix dunnii]
MLEPFIQKDRRRVKNLCILQNDTPVFHKLFAAYSIIYSVCISRQQLLQHDFAQLEFGGSPTTWQQRQPSKNHELRIPH